ncbi:MAG TPA: DUF6282 family protein [Gammaproteobacteria bacterium]|nr:DUF6282 family protein [Gammaproteobacteria bacterium]
MKRILPMLSLILPCIAAAQIEGAIDLHVHSAPDSIPRALTAIETAQLARRHRMRAVLFKNHFVETATLAYLVSQVVPEVEAYGGIALNRSVGGINVAAVEQMAAMTGGHGRVVWMPTVDAAQGPFAAAVEQEDILPVSRDGALLPEVMNVLELIAELDLALATGHSSPQDSLLLVRAAEALGIERIVITHPFDDLAMPLEFQREVVRLGAYLEFPIAMATPIGTTPLEEFAAQIRAIGPENVVLSTDLGQAANPVPAAGFATAVTRLLDAGFTERELDLMIRRNPAHILNLVP